MSWGLNNMIKENIKTVVDTYNSKIQNILNEITVIDSKDHYTNEYKKQQKDPKFKQIKDLKIEAKNKMLDAFNTKIDEIKNKEVFNFSDIETSNILKMIEIGITSMRTDEIQYLVDKYSDNPVIYRAIESQVKRNDIMNINMPFKTFMPNTKEIENLRDTLCNSMDMNDNSLFSSLAFKMTMANNDNIF